MNRRIRITETTLRPIRDISTPLPQVNPEQICEALGADPAAEEIAAALVPITLLVCVKSY